MIKRYLEFLAENVQRSKAIIAQRMKDYESLKERLTRDNTLGYLGKLTELLFRDEPVSDIMAAYDRLMALRRASVRLDIEGTKTLEQLQDLLETKEIDQQVAQTLSKFPPAQRRLFPLVTMTKQDRVLLSGMAKVDTAPFMRKVSQYRDKASLVENAKRFMKSVSTPADREHFKGLAGGGLKLVHEDDRLLIFRTDTVKDLLKIASDAAWCIKNPGTFKQYTSYGAAQFVLIDYDRGRWDPMFKVGFTVAANGKITYAHDVLDNSVIPQVRELLAAQAMSLPAILSGKPGRPKLPGAGSTPTKIQKWIDENGALPGEARELLTLVSGKINPEDLSEYLVRDMLDTLLRAVHPERMLTVEELAELLPGPLVSAIKQSHMRYQHHGDFRESVLFDPRAKNITHLADARMLPLLDMMKHDVFRGVRLADAVRVVLQLVRSQEVRMARPDIADQVRRFIALHDKVADNARKDVLLAAVDKAETGRSPEYQIIDPLLRASTSGDSERFELLDRLEVRIPFDEKVALSYIDVDSLIALMDFGRGVTLKDVLNSGHVRLFNQLVGAGINVSVETDRKSVTQMLEYLAVWTTATGQYRAAAAGLPEWAENPALRRHIIRPQSRRQGRFAFATGTEFPVTYSLPGRYTVTIKKATSSD